MMIASQYNFKTIHALIYNVVHKTQYLIVIHVLCVYIVTDEIGQFLLLPSDRAS